jgi:cobaltochelatase CobN
MKFRQLLVLGLLICLSPSTVTATKVAVLSTSFVLEHKFKLMESIAHDQALELAWTQVDREGEAGVKRVLNDADFIIIDAPNNEAISQVEQAAGEQLRTLTTPTLSIHRFNPSLRIQAQHMEEVHARQLFTYYTSGMRVNRERMLQYLKAWLDGEDITTVAPPVELPNGGIYHPDAEQMVFASLSEYLDWWQQQHQQTWQEKPVIGMETASSYLSDGQTRQFDETITAIERAGGVPLIFYRSARPYPNPTSRSSENTQITVQTISALDSSGFPNPSSQIMDVVDEPLIMLNGKTVLHVLMVNTFLGINPDGRKAWYQSLDIPVINFMQYRNGNRADYAADKAGVSSFMLPFMLTVAEYIGLQDPVLVTTNETGELVAMPEQMDLLVGKLVNLAQLAMLPNAEKNVALLFWNHPPGEHNHGASNLNVPRSITHLIEHLRNADYAFDSVNEEQIIDAVGRMLRPVYRKNSLPELMQTPHWDFLPLVTYNKWFATLPTEVREQINTYWGEAKKSRWIVQHEDGTTGFIIPRLKLGRLVVLPQPPRGGTADESEEKLLHDIKVPTNHFYLATYLWLRTQQSAHAIVHFGTHGSQEWASGKERGLWAFDDPNLLVGNIPVIYPYIIDNIAEAIHVKRRGRGVIISHQTPPFSPAGLSNDFIQINEAIREYESLDEGLVKENARKQIIDLVVKMNIHQDLSWKIADLERDFPNLLREIDDYLEHLAITLQPLGLHVLGEDMERAHMVSTVMQMLGQPLYAALGFKDAGEVFTDDYQQIQASTPYRFVDEWVLSNKSLDTLENKTLIELAEHGRSLATTFRAANEIESVLRALSARWIDPSYGGDPIRNPDALPTGRNMYGFDPSRIPTRAAYEAGKESLQHLVLAYQTTHGGQFPDKLAFTLWSTETMRHLGMLEAQILYAMGVRPIWDEGGRVTGMEKIPLAELGRPRIDPVIAITGLYRDQFPNVIERLNEAIVMLAETQDEPLEQNYVRANSLRILAAMLAQGLSESDAYAIAHTRVFGNESGNYGTGLPDATLASNRWEEGDGKLEQQYLSSMSWTYGPDTSSWSKKFTTSDNDEINAYAEHLRGTRAAVFSRSSNLRGLLDTDHPFEYLGGISMAVRHLDGTAPQLYISNMRDPSRAQLEAADKFLSTELRSVYQHPNWVKEMIQEGYSGTLQLLNTINNFWGWQVMDRTIVRDDQWQSFHEIYVNDRYQLGLREWFEAHQPAALAQIAERMLEAIRKDYWKASEETKKELVQTYERLVQKYDVHTDNQTFKAYVSELSAGYGLSTALVPDAAIILPAQPETQESEANKPTENLEQVQGQIMQEQQSAELSKPQPKWWLLLLAILVLGVIHQIWLRHQNERIRF